MYAIRVRNLSKQFILHDDKPKTLKEKFIRLNHKSENKHLKVLDSISIDVKKGQVVGLIGRNGSGKSTLLKILSKIIYPTEGNIIINGRVTSLLELGAGFHPDFTGIENIYMNASLFGLSKKEIDSKLDDIILFSELNEFIYRPVRIYSSGMYMRLAFSIATVVEPDILLIDEVLAVGDSAFQQKCINRIMQLKEKGKTIVLVAHDSSVIERLCDYCIWLKDGKVMAEGMAKSVLVSYLDDLGKDESERISQLEYYKEPSNSKEETTAIKPEQSRWGNFKVEILEVDIVDSNGTSSRSFITGDYFGIKFKYKMNHSFENVAIGFGLFRNDGLCCYGSNTNIEDIDVELNNEGEILLNIPIMNLLPGEYWIDVAIHSREGEPYDYLQRAKTFVIQSEKKDIGIIRLDHKWNIK